MHSDQCVSDQECPIPEFPQSPNRLPPLPTPCLVLITAHCIIALPHEDGQNHRQNLCNKLDLKGQKESFANFHCPYFDIFFLKKPFSAV